MANYIVWTDFDVDKDRFYRLHLLTEGVITVNNQVTGEKTCISKYIPDFFELYINCTEHCVVGEPWRTAFSGLGKYLLPTISGKELCSIPILNLCVQESKNEKILYSDGSKNEFLISQTLEIHSRYDLDSFGFGLYDKTLQEKIRSHLAK